MVVSRILWLCFAHRRDIIFISDVLSKVLREGVDIHFLCTKSGDLQLFFGEQVPMPVKLLSWCNSWDSYFRAIDSVVLQNQQAVVITSAIIWNNTFLRAINLRSEICPRFTWVTIADEEVVEYPRTGRTPCKVWTCFAAPSNSSVNLVDVNYFELHSPRQAEHNPSRWSGLSLQTLSIGCFMQVSTTGKLVCLSNQEKRVLNALARLNATFDVVKINTTQLTEYIARQKIDVMAHPVGLSPSRYQRFDFTLHEFGRATYYVQKRFNHGGELFSGPLSWTALLAVSLLVTTGFFVLLNVRLGRQPSEGIAQLALALAAAVLLIATPVRRFHGS